MSIILPDCLIEALQKGEVTYIRMHVGSMRQGPKAINFHLIKDVMFYQQMPLINVETGQRQNHRNYRNTIAYTEVVEIDLIELQQSGDEVEFLHKVFRDAILTLKQKTEQPPVIKTEGEWDRMILDERNRGVLRNPDGQTLTDNLSAFFHSNGEIIPSDQQITLGLDHKSVFKNPDKLD